MDEKKLKKLANSVARKYGYGRATSIYFGNVNEPMIVKAEGWHYTTKAGKKIRHPSAYSAIGWSNMVYHPAHCEVMMPLQLIDWGS